MVKVIIRLHHVMALGLEDPRGEKDFLHQSKAEVKTVLSRSEVPEVMFGKWRWHF